MYCTTCTSPYGEIVLTANDQGLTALAFQTENTALSPSDKMPTQHPILTQTIAQLNAYFAGELTQFTVPLAAQGTPFQQRVWQALANIPYGKTVSYRLIAKKIGHEKAVRAVGSANGANPIALIVPCHRVIGANKKLTGYAGGLALKAKLLNHEKADFSV